VAERSEGHDARSEAGWVIWTVTCRSVEHEGVRGVAVLVTDGDTEHEVGRVAYVRKGSENPKRDFGAQLDDVLERADRVVTEINDLGDELQRLADDADREREEQAEKLSAMARKTITEALGSRPSKAMA
jgi:hypothetical protein